MFTRNISRRKILLIFALFLLFIISIISIRTNLVIGYGGIVPPPPPTKVQVTYEINDELTATPNVTLQAQYRMTVYPTPTDITISKYTDLSPSISDQDKFQVIIKHKDGTYEQFTIGPLRSSSDLDNGLPDYIITGIPLEPGDEIMGWLPPVAYQRFAPGVLETLIPKRTPSITIYPTEFSTELPMTTAPYPNP